jgi:nitrate reductase assembly molybdenum cofactor insertion protein NarJ
MTVMHKNIREYLYLFSILFYTPTPQSIERAKKIASLIGDEFIKNILNNKDVDDLLREYTKTFHGGVRAGACSPYESFYREGLAYGETAVKILKMLREKGFELNIEGEQADHIAVELEFASFTLDEEMIKRLKEWAPKFYKCLENRSLIYSKFAEKLMKILEEI